MCGWRSRGQVTRRRCKQAKPQPASPWRGRRPCVNHGRAKGCDSPVRWQERKPPPRVIQNHLGGGTSGSDTAGTTAASEGAPGGRLRPPLCHLSQPAPGEPTRRTARATSCLGPSHDTLGARRPWASGSPVCRSHSHPRERLGSGSAQPFT